MDLAFDGLDGASCRVDVEATASRLVAKVCLRGIRRSLGLGEHIGCELHWACLADDGAWHLPAEQPSGSRAVDAAASRIECKFDAALAFARASAPGRLTFVVLVHANGGEHWLKARGGDNFVLPLAELAAKMPAPAAAAASGGGGGGGPERLAPRPPEWPELAAALAAAAEASATGARRRRCGAPGAPVAEAGEAEVEGCRGRLTWRLVRSGGGVGLFLEASLPLPEAAVLSLHFGCQEAPGGEWEEPREPVTGVRPFGDGKASRALFEGQARTLLHFSEQKAPAAIVFVLHVDAGAGEQWLKDSSGSDFSVALSASPASAAATGGGRGEQTARTFCDAETKYTHWSHFQRLCLVNELVSRKEALDEVEAAWIACDLRLANAKVLEWYRQRGYQPKDMAHCQEQLGGNLASAVGAAESATVRALLRLAVSACPRGNASGGDAIRHGILNIMRTHGIREGHRPGIECKFIEQWHQKLHTNSAPDDIAICEGYLAFLSSGNPDDLFRTVWERARLTREDMAKMAGCGFKDHTKSGASGLNVNPVHLPQLYNDMQGYLGLLKHVHGGTGLFDLCEACKGQYPDHGCECLAFEVFHERESPLVLGKIVELRARLAPCLGKRDVLMLDCALEDQLRLSTERQDPAAMAQEDLLGLLGCLLRDLRLSRHDASLDMGAELLARLAEGDGGGHARWSAEWCRLLLAACDRLSLECAERADAAAGLLQACADRLAAAGARPGAAFSPDGAALAAFGEEAARCLSERVVARFLRALQPKLRRGAGLGPWELVSAGRGAAVGAVEVMAALPAALPAGKAPCVAVAETLTGWEDIPAGIVAVLLPASQAVDVLSHVAIRARNQGVLLASCDDEGLLGELRGRAGETLSVSVGASGDVAWVAAAREVGTPAGSGDGGAVDGGGGGRLVARRPPSPPSLVLPMSEFAKHAGCFGGKSLHLSELAPKNGEYAVPPSATVPFGVFEDVLRASANEELRGQLEDLAAEGDWPEMRKLVIEELELPSELEEAVAGAMSMLGAPLPADTEWQRALKGVWASKWTERAVSSRRQVGFSDEDIQLAVLVQPLAFASYAFVIHTRSPMAGAREGDALVEVVVGLGESLVSNSPGRALSASVGPGGSEPEVHTYPSKPAGVFAPDAGTHIFRSDSNGEDLEGFAGAGLYDSVTAAECPRRPVPYAAEPLLFDAAFRAGLLRRLFDLGRLVEAGLGGGPQDIEGAVLRDGSLVVLQSRPQV